MVSADVLDPESQSPWPPSCPEGEHECKEDDIFKRKICSPPDDICPCINCCIDPPTCKKCDDLPAQPPPPSSRPFPPSPDPDDFPPPPTPIWRNDLCTQLDEKFKFPTTKPCEEACKTGCDCLCEAMGSSVIDQYCEKEASKLDRCRCCCKDVTEVERLQLSDSGGESDAPDFPPSNKEEELQY
ncbi:hypothetical protein MKX03_035116 [Papaver bracteatum]|nr:hypothetical protein MKX03_035116 [Papaver bracteatum]